jgi:FkbM family methyltransferase
VPYTSPMVSPGKSFRDLRYSLFYGALLTRRFPLISLGDTVNACNWTITPKGLNSHSIVYSGGVGNDISFEHALVKEFGVQVFLFDPSPTGLATMARPENQTRFFHFRPFALAERSGTLKLSPPANTEEGSWYSGNAASAQLEVAAMDLASVMRQNGHTHIDFLKLDIEGSEYGVIDHILDQRLDVRQICVEYHHGILPGFSRGQTIRSIMRLVRRGYKLLDQSGNNHTFFRS